jgi:serine/threonine protein kinase
MSATQQQTDYATILAYLMKHEIQVYDFVNHLKKGREIGSGAVMTVYQGALTRHGEASFDVALKEPKLYDNMREAVISNVLDDVRQELRIMKNLELHPYVISLYGVAFEGLRPILIVELAVANLSYHLESCKERGNRVDWHTKGRFCSEIADGLHALHLVKIVHGDIKGDNILLFTDPVSKTDKTLIAKISDFGYSCTKSSISRGRGVGGTTIFEAPERSRFAPEDMIPKANQLSTIILMGFWYGKLRKMERTHFTI